MPEDGDSLVRPDFDQASTQFVEWFTAADGTRLNAKIQLQDLSAEGAGRGAGMLSFLTVYDVLY